MQNQQELQWRPEQERLTRSLFRLTLSTVTRCEQRTCPCPVRCPGCTCGTLIPRSTFRLKTRARRNAHIAARTIASIRATSRIRVPVQLAANKRLFATKCNESRENGKGLWIRWQWAQSEELV